MEKNYYDIEACIRLAERQRSEALGNLIAAGWNYCRQHLASLFSHCVAHTSTLVKHATSAG